MSDSLPLEPGLTGEASAQVSADLTANVLGSGDVAVYATPALVALLEAAAIHALKGRLPEGHTSVGTSLTVRHLAATPVGMTVQARATLIEVDGRRLVFEVAAWDPVEPIGEGTHERVIVSKARFEERAQAKKRQE